MNKAVFFISIILMFSCSSSEIRADKIEWTKYSSDSSIIEIKSIAVDSTITWKVTYENSIVNKHINGKLQTAHYNKPLKTMGAYMLSNDSVIFTVDQNVSFLENDTIESYETTGNPFVSLDLRLKDSTFYQDLFIFKPFFCDSTAISLIRRNKDDKHYIIKEVGFNNEFLTLSFKYDIYNFYEIEMSLWFHESDSNYIFKEIINSKLFTTPPSSP